MTAARDQSTVWTKRAAAAAETREAILAAACKVIADVGFENIRMRMVAVAAGVSTAALHYHFDTRENLFAEALRYSFERTGADVYEARGASDSATARLARIVSASLPVTPSLKQEWSMWQELWCRANRDADSRTLAVELYRQHHRWIQETIADGIATGEFAACDAAAHAKLVSCLCDGFGVQVMLRNIPVAEARAAIWRLAAGPLGIDAAFPGGGRGR
jgi:AcrR family transcriptional regulator